MFCKYCGAKLIRNHQEIICRKCKRKYKATEGDFFQWNFSKKENSAINCAEPQKFSDEETNIRTTDYKETETMEKTRIKIRKSKIIMLLTAVCIILLSVSTILSQIQITVLKQQYKNLQTQNQKQLNKLKKKIDDINDDVGHRINRLETELNQYEQEVQIRDYNFSDTDYETTGGYGEETESEEWISDYQSQANYMNGFTENQTEGDSNEQNR